MNIEYSGYKEGYGRFTFQIPVDETKTDYIIYMYNGPALHQDGPFEMRTADWNCDGDIYPLFGAFFRGPVGGADFLTPTDMVELVVHNQATIPGITDPFQSIPLTEQIQKAEGRRPAPAKTSSDFSEKTR